MLKTNLNTLPIVIIATLLAIATGHFVFKHIEEARTADLDLLIAEHEADLMDYSNMLRTNRATHAVSMIVHDCSPDKRAQFDAALSRLSELKRSELESLDRIFAECAYFYPEQQALMSMLLNDKFESYVDLLDMFSERARLLDPRTEERLLWRKLVELEATRSGLSLELVEVQRNILNMLLSGSASTDPAFDAERKKATEILDRTITAMNEIESVRKELNSP